MKRKPMKPILGWALVSKKTRRICTGLTPCSPLLVYADEAIAKQSRFQNECIVPVEIRQMALKVAADTEAGIQHDRSAAGKVQRSK